MLGSRKDAISADRGQGVNPYSTPKSHVTMQSDSPPMADLDVPICCIGHLGGHDAETRHVRHCFHLIIQLCVEQSWRMVKLLALDGADLV